MYTARETSRRRVFDPYAPLLFNLYHYLEQNLHFGLVPEHQFWVSRGRYYWTGSTPALFQEAVRAVWERVSAEDMYTSCIHDVYVYMTYTYTYVHPINTYIWICIRHVYMTYTWHIHNRHIHIYVFIVCTYVCMYIQHLVMYIYVWRIWR